MRLDRLVHQQPKSPVLGSSEGWILRFRGDPSPDSNLIPKRLNDFWKLSRRKSLSARTSQQNHLSEIDRLIQVGRPPETRIPPGGVSLILRLAEARPRQLTARSSHVRGMDGSQ